MNVPGIFLESDWFWTFSVAIMDGENTTPVAAARWGISKTDAPSPIEAYARINAHCREESRLQALLRPNRWISVFPMDGNPIESIENTRHFWRGELIARGSMFRKKPAKTTPEIVEFQLSLW